MNWIPRVSAIALTFVAFATVGGAQTSSIPIGKNGDVELTEPTSLGTTVLKPGHYRFKYATEDNRHFLVVSQQQTQSLRGGQHYATGGGPEVARVACEVVKLDAKVKNTELHTRKQADGSRVITQIRIRGEGAGHLLGLEPKS